MSATAKHITKADVVAICDQLEAEGITPTSTRIRKELGRGSLSTVVRHLKEWQQGKAQSESGHSGHSPDLPLALQSFAESIARQAWEHALEGAQASVSAERDVLAKQRDVWEREIEAAAALTDQAERQHAHLEQRVEMLLGELETRKNITTDLRLENTRVMAKNEALTQREQSLEDEVAALQGTISDKEAALASLQDAFDNMTQDAKAWETEAEGRQQRLEHTKNALRASQDEARKTEEDNAQLRKSLNKALDEAKKLSSQLADCTHQRQLAESETRHAREDADRLEREVAAAKAAATEADSRRQQALEEKAQLSGQVEALRDQVHELRADIKDLNHELSLRKAAADDEDGLAEHPHKDGREP